jgi:hypothetical protein
MLLAGFTPATTERMDRWGKGDIDLGPGRPLVEVIGFDGTEWL